MMKRQQRLVFKSLDLEVLSICKNVDLLLAVTCHIPRSTNVVQLVSVCLPLVHKESAYTSCRLALNRFTFLLSNCTNIVNKNLIAFFLCKTVEEYLSPQINPSEAYFAEHFDDPEAFNSRWVKSEAKKQGVDENIAKYDGKWEVCRHYLCFHLFD